MKLVKESLLEFYKPTNVKNAANIGIDNKIKTDLRQADIESKYVNKNGHIIWPINDYYYSIYKDKLYNIQIKYATPEEKDFLENLKNDQTDLNIEKQIEKAIANNIDKETIFHMLYLLMGVESKNYRITIKKASRSQEEKDKEDSENIYVFIGYNEKTPVKVNGKKYYEDKFVVENMVKIDKYKFSDLASINMLKARAKIQYGNDANANAKVYMLKIPKEVMNKDHYYKIPDYLQDIVEKYKVII